MLKEKDDFLIIFIGIQSLTDDIFLPTRLINTYVLCAAMI